MKAPPLSKESHVSALARLLLQDDDLHNYLNSLPLLENNQTVGATFNSLAFDFSPHTSFDNVLFDTLYNEFLVLVRNNSFDSAMGEIFSEDAKNIHSHQEADKVIPTEDYLPEFSCIPEHHPLISLDLLGMPVSNGTYDPLISSDDLLDLLGIPVSNGTYDSVEGGNYIQEVGQIEANILVPDCDGKNIISEMQPLTLMDRNQIDQSWNDEVVCIGSGIQGLALDRHCLENNMNINTSNINTTKSDERNASNQIGRSTLIMPFQDLTNKELNPPNLKRKRNDQIDLDASCLTHENEAESAEFCQSISIKKRKINTSNQTREEGECNNCKCRKTQCLKLYCACFAAGVYCTKGPCSCQNCLNKPINKDIVLEARKKIEDRKKGGCNCNKSSCQKKYCECLKAGVGCSPSCNCRGCENIHGRKDR